jgi:hypothetical protein
MSKIPEFVSSSELADFLGVSPRRVNQLCAEELFEKGNDGLICFRVAVDAYYDNKIGSISDPYKAAQARLNLSRAQNLEAETKRTLGELMKPTDIQARYFAEIGPWIGRIQGLDGVVAALVDWGKAEATPARWELHTHLTWISRELRDLDIFGKRAEPADPAQLN